MVDNGKQEDDFHFFCKVYVYVYVHAKNNNSLFRFNLNIKDLFKPFTFGFWQ